MTPPTTDTATITEISVKETVTWTMPRATYDWVTLGLETWAAHYRRPSATVERVLSLLESQIPDIRESVTREVKPAPPAEKAVRGLKADILITDTLPDTP